MTDMMRIVTIGALLHDIGKAIIRVSGERKTHSQLGADFLRPFCDISEAGEAVVRCVRYHHGRELSGAHLSPRMILPISSTKRIISLPVSTGVIGMTGRRLSDSTPS